MTQGPPTPGSPPTALPADASAGPTYRVALPEFEGPLDLLLHLCETHEIDILNISVAFIAEKYIEYLGLMQNMAVEVAADYLVMAAHLAYLKSRELVPTPEPLEPTEDGEEPMDPRQELIRRLLEYQKYKHAAESLGNRPIEGRTVFVRGVALEAQGEAEFAEHSVWKLLEHWASALTKAKPEHTHDVVVDRISITDRINHIVDMLEAGKGMVRFEDLLAPSSSPAELRHEVVVSLLAVLELARLRVVRVLQQETTGTFFLAQVDGAVLDDARTLTVTSARESAPPGAETPASTNVRAASAAASEESATDPPSADPESEARAPAAEVAEEALELRPQEGVVSSTSPASARAGEEATDGQEKQAKD
jgi:segregation and condensation protein A